MLKFASTEEALQHLSNLTGKKIKIADEILSLDKALSNEVKAEDLKEIKKILDSGFTPSQNHLDLAILTRSSFIVKMLLDAGAKFSSYNLNTAIKTKDKEVIKVLLDAGAKFSSYDLNNAVWKRWILLVLGISRYVSNLIENINLWKNPLEIGSSNNSKSDTNLLQHIIDT